MGSDERELEDISQQNKRESFVHVAATMGGHNGAEMEEEEMSDEEGNNQSCVIELPDDDDMED